LVEPLGSGGMASVWVAEHLTLHTRVVVKFIISDLAGNEDARARFSREAAAAAAVKSPHVVQVFDHGISDGHPFIVMELLEGEDLRVRLERSTALMLGDVESVVSQTCKALAQAHRAGIVHRDIKPDNIFLCKNEENEIFVKLLDFGIAKIDDAAALGATRTGALMGTPYYMSPEQVIGAKNVDLRTDLWSLGVVAFEAMTGTKAFDGQTLGALAVAITHGPMPVPSQRNPLLPPSVDEWFARACSRDVAGRFPSAKEMGNAFRTASTGAPVTGSSLPKLSMTTPLGAPSLPTTTPLAVVPMTTTPLAAHPPTNPPLRTAPMPARSHPQVSASASTTTAPVHGTINGGVPMSSPRPALIAGVAAGVLVLLGGIGVFLASSHHEAAQSVVTSPTTLPSAAATTEPSATVSALFAPAASASVLAPVDHPPIRTGHVQPPALRDAGIVKPVTSGGASKPNCDPAYTTDKDGIQHWKKECVSQ
jgi:eukaryotic-like serine/threonine-protein kinase